MNPNYDFFDMFVQGLGSAEVLVAVIGFISAAAFAGFGVTKIGHFFLPQPRETRVSDFMPFKKILSDGITIQCYNDSLVRVFQVEGVDGSFVTESQLYSLFEAKKSWIDSMSDLNVNCRVLTTRELVEITNYKANFNNDLLEDVSDAWRSTLERVYKNYHYVVISVENRKDCLQDLNYASQSLLAVLSEYGVKALVETEDSPAHSSPLSVYVKICNPITRPQPKFGTTEGSRLNEMMTAEQIHFTGEDGIIKFKSGDKELLEISIGIRSCGDFMETSMINSILAIDSELIFMHNIKPIPKTHARAMLMQQQKMATMTSFSSNVFDQYSEALSSIESSDADSQSLVEYAQVVILKAKTMEELEFAESEVQRICRLFANTPIREGWVAQATFFNQFPTYEAYPRTYRYLSRVVASAVSFDKPSEGFDKSDWGVGPISVFRTVSGSPYMFQFHVSSEESAVAHCCIIGPTGQGKTTLLTFLAGQAMRHGDLKVFFFDRHRGAEIFTRSVGGAYVGFDGDNKNVSLNPFDCTDTANNKAFLRRWLKSITMVDDSLSEREVARAVTTAFDYLRPEERVMTNLYKSCFSPTGNMRREMYRWINPDQYGGIFNATNDSLDLSAKRFMAFDFTHIFEDETLAPAVISYIMHRIQVEAGETGAPSLIMIDETAPMLKHPMFRDYFIIGLQEGRKKRQAYLCAFQQPNVIDKLGVGEVIRGQCQTVLFFRNPQAMPEDYANWNLTESEMDFIFGRNYRDFPYAILLSRPSTGESVILDVDLGALGPYLRLYNSGRKNVLLVEQLIKEHGEENFVTTYLNM
ncbi:MAG: hypothetical protein R3Y43_06185 [Alphaproteobacteria bacterium]